MSLLETSSFDPIIFAYKRREQEVNSTLGIHVHWGGGG